MAGVSLCMILKNEEDWIEGAIESVKDLTDEIILVDTGSTDATIERVRRFSPRIIPFSWINDFSAARNVSLQAASHPWILVLDADERISLHDIPLLKSAMQGTDDGFHLVQRNYTYASNVIGWTPNDGAYPEASPYAGYVDNPLIRFFKNSPDVRFTYAVHEIIDPTRMSARFKFSNLPVPIHHFGKVRDRERLAQKQRLYLEIGLKKLEREPRNWKAHFELGVQCQELNRHVEASGYFETAWKLSKLPFVLLYWAVSEKNKGQLLKAAELIELAARLGVNTYELHLELGNVYQGLGDLEKAHKHYERSLKLQPSNPLSAFNTGLVYRKLGKKAEAEALYRQALKLEPAFREPALELSALLLDEGKFAEAYGVLMSVYAREPECREVRLGLSKYYIQIGSAKEALRLLGDISAEDATAQCLAGAAYLQENDLDQAQQFLERALKRDRNLVDARINLAEVYARKGEHAKAARYMMIARGRIAELTNP